MNYADSKTINFLESRERYTMSQLFKQYLKPIYFEKYYTELYFTPTLRDINKTTLPYDAVILLRDKITMTLIHKFIIEVKCREEDYPTIMLEKKRFNQLNSEYRKALKIKAPTEEITILYINFMPSGAYIFNLTSDKVISYITTKKNREVATLVSSTFIEDDIKINKDIVYLPKDFAKYYPLTIEKDYSLIYAIDNKQVEKNAKDYNKVIKTYSLF